MVNLLSMLKSIAEKTAELKDRLIVKRAVYLMASFCPGTFDFIGHSIQGGEFKAESIFGNKAGYELFRKIWKERYDERLPEYS